MQNTTLLLMLCGALGLLCGCASVPKTTIKFDPAGKAVDIASPKDVEMKNLKVSVQGTNFTVSVEDYSSKQNVEVVKSVMEANIQQAQMALEAAKKVLATVASTAK